MRVSVFSEFETRDTAVQPRTSDTTHCYLSLLSLSMLRTACMYVRVRDLCLSVRKNRFSSLN